MAIPRNIERLILKKLEEMGKVFMQGLRMIYSRIEDNQREARRRQKDRRE